MSTYDIEVRPAALRELRKIDRSTQPEFEERLHFSRKIRDRQLRVNSEDAMVIDSELATIGLSTRSMMECC